MAGRLKGKGPSESPRDRLFKRGSEALSDAELIALLVFGGCCEYEMLDRVEQLLEYGGGLAGVARMGAEELVTHLGISAATAAALVAAVELERRMSKPIEERTPKLDHPTVACEYLLQQFENDGRDLYGLLSLDCRHRLIRQHLSDAAQTTAEYCWFRDGLVDQRELVKQAILDDASAIMIFRNHSSPWTALLRHDYDLAGQLLDPCMNIGVPLLDYLVICYPDCASMRTETPLVFDYGDKSGEYISGG